MKGKNIIYFLVWLLLAGCWAQSCWAADLSGQGDQTYINEPVSLAQRPQHGSAMAFIPPVNCPPVKSAAPLLMPDDDGNNDSDDEDIWGNDEDMGC